MTSLNISDESGPGVVFAGGPHAPTSLNFEQVNLIGALAKRAADKSKAGDVDGAIGELVDALYALQGFLSELTRGLENRDIHVQNYPTEDAYLERQQAL